MNSTVKTFILLFISFSLINCSSPRSQNKKSKIEKEEEKESEDDFGEPECVIDKGFTPGKTGLFESRAIVQVVSFEDTTYSEQPCELSRGKFKTINQIESITLNDKQKKELERILYKTKTKRAGNVSLASACYVPRHAIVYSGTNETIAFTEICFECNGQRAKGKISTYIDFCDSKWMELKDFFKSVGITYFGSNYK